MPITNKIITNLIKRNISISVAESCTGGLISYTLSKYTGVSKIFSGGLVCYSNKSKIKYLSISKNKLSNFGAVSLQVAENMIDNLYKLEKTNVCIATTGIAGPNGGSKEKPVGLVFIGLKIRKKNFLYKKNFKGGRLNIQRKTRDFIFKKIQELI